MRRRTEAQRVVARLYRPRRGTRVLNMTKLVKCCENEAFEDEGRHGLDCPRRRT